MSGAASPEPAEQSGALRRLRHLRRVMRVMLWLERATVAAWPAASLLGAFILAALLGVPERLPALLHSLLLVALLGGVIWFGWRARRKLGWPGLEDADRRLETVSGVAHRPLAVLADRPAAVGRAELWTRHRARALAQVPSLRWGWPRPGMAARDPRALRHLLLLGLACAVVIAGPDASQRLLSGLIPRFPAAPPLPQLEVRAWVAPPAYTSLPPTLLPDPIVAGSRVTVPSGSRVTVGLSGGRGAVPVLALGAAERGFAAIGPDSFEAQADLATDGRLAVKRDGVEIASWDITVRPDQPPTVTWAHPPAALRGRIPQTRLAWHVRHEYGVAGLAADIRLRDRAAVPPLVVPLALPGARPRDAGGVATQDLTAHPWAGLPVTITLSGRDGAGLTGTSDVAAFVLPARHFRHPGAQAIIVSRQKLALAPEAGSEAATALRALADRVDLWGDGDGAPETLRAIAATLEGTPAPAVVDHAQSALWDLALRLEESTPAKTAEALRRAQQELHAALDKAQAQDKTQATPRDKSELDRRAQALADALHRHEQAMAEQARRDPGSVAPLTPQDRAAAERALQELRDAANADRMDEAQERMAELDQMLDSMRQAARSEAQRKRAEGRQKGRQQMDVMQDLVRRETGEIDHAEARQADQGDPEPLAAQRDGDLAVQKALRRVLGELMQQHGDLTGQVPKNFGDADTAMRETAQGLNEGRDDVASAAAQRAVAALEQTGQEMQQSLARKFGPPRRGPGEQQPGEGQGQPQPGDGGDSGDQMAEADDGSDPGEGSGSGQGQAGQDDAADGDADRQPGPNGQQAGRQHDPFGRGTHEGMLGTDNGSDTQVPEEMEQARGRAVQDELRRREAQRTRPQNELDYIGRLLKQD